MTTLVIVESPAKAKTIKKYLGKGYEVVASMGHVRDLIPKTGAVEPDNGFQMHYEVVEKSTDHVKRILSLAKDADQIYLAADPDREGEAISWHIAHLLSENKKTKDKPIARIVFHEITKSAIQHAAEQTREISMDLVNAQQARRALDYLVGFTLSPLLWKKIRRGLSAGRVQSPALRLIVEREEEIEAFQRQEYWHIEAACQKSEEAFSAKLVRYEDEKVEQFRFTNATDTLAAKNALFAQAGGKLTVSNVEKKQRKRNPAPPFITSTLQQDAARKLGLTTQRTMRLAQQLYEEGYITYMRTDSVNLSGEALAQIRSHIEKNYGKDFLPDAPRVFKTKSKNAQEAHEAIRPTNVEVSPSSISLSPDHKKLYDLIWKRAVASQMQHATIHTVSVTLDCPPGAAFRATGSTITHPGFLKLYQEGKDDGAADDDAEKLLPEMQVGDVITLKDILAEQHFTEPPPRYGEATLVKALEEYGIGRPSTYASIIATLQNREYVYLQTKRFFPTDVGRVVNRFLTEHFTQYVNYDFTANLENSLDAVARGEQQWIPLMEDFWQPFKSKIAEIEGNVSRKDVTQELLEEQCPECGKPLAKRLGKRGAFIGCTAYPDCTYTRNLDNGETKKAPEIVEGKTCPKCHSDLYYREGRYGRFIGCSKYPECDYIESLNQPVDTGVECPVCHKGNLMKRRSRRGKTFYSCARYPECKYAIWDEPIAETCPDCGWPILTRKQTKAKGVLKVCPEKDCGYSEAAG